jgi:peroxiredoxin family protein
MDVLIQVSSGYLDTIIPSLIIASRLKNEGTDVAVLFQWRALVTYSEKKFEYSPSIAKYAATIGGCEKKIGLPLDPMDFLKRTRAAGIPIYSFAVEAELSGIKEKVPPEIQLIDEEGLTKLILEVKKVVSGF